MRKSIFNLDYKGTYKDEYIKINKVLSTKCITFQKKNLSYFEFVNNYLFQNWKYRSTFIDLYDYLEFLGININSRKITEESFINYLEFLLNMQLLLESMKYYNDNIVFSVTCKSILFHNIPIILDQYDYQAYDIDDRVFIYKKDIQYEDLFEIVPNDIYDLMLSYCSINNTGIKIKRIILNKLYTYLLKDVDKYKTYNSTIFSSIKMTVTKMGILGDIDSKYKHLTNYKLRKYYDNCFQMIVYLIKTENIYKYKEELKNI